MSGDAIWALPARLPIDADQGEGGGMRRFVGIDVAITAEHRACLTDEAGNVLAERRLRTTRGELQELWAIATRDLGQGDEVVVVMEPTANAWVAPAAFFRSRGARVHLVPPEQSADLRRYYAKHVKNDRLDAKLLARLPRLHPEGLHEATVPQGSQGTLRRQVARRAGLMRELTQHRHRIRALLHLAMPELNRVFGEELGKAALAVLERAGDPRRMLRLGRARLAALLKKASRGAWREPKAEQILHAARAAVELWEGLPGCDFSEIADDLAAEVRLIRALEAEVAEIDARASGLLGEIDPQGLHLSLPGFGERTATTVAGRLGDVNRFTNNAAVRSFVGMIPGTDQSGESEGHPRLTKAGDPILRTALFLAAEAARKEDPQLAQTYYRQMVDKGNHHTKAVCAVATALTSRLAAVLREGRPYAVRDVDGTEVDPQTARRIIAERYTVPAAVRVARRRPRRVQHMKGRPVDGVRSKTSPPSPPADEAPTHDANPVLLEA
jgi:transposase